MGENLAPEMANQVRVLCASSVCLPFPGSKRSEVSQHKGEGFGDRKNVNLNLGVGSLSTSFGTAILACMKSSLVQMEITHLFGRAKEQQANGVSVERQKAGYLCH